MLDEQIKFRTQALILNPLKAMDQVLEQEYAKGEVAALKLALALPETMLEEVINEIAKLKEELKNDAES